jgi:hypothetical protein
LRRGSTHAANGRLKLLTLPKSERERCGPFVLIFAVLGIALSACSGTRPASFKELEYTIEGETVLLQNGVAEREAAPGSAAKVSTRYFGNEVEGDLDGDGILDIAFLLTQDGGGSGTSLVLSSDAADVARLKAIYLQ